ncbi:MAG: ChuX/HutX family heme-like substrate-binding protein [Flavobacteriales bacterium]
MSTTTTPDLKSRLAALKAAQPHTYLRNAAAELGVSEVELLATRLGEGVTRLHDDPKAILADVPTLGRVMALTRNNDVVHERKGTYANPTLDGHVGLFVGADIDLRIFWSHWASAFAVEEEGRDGLRRSLQFFSPTGVAVHKIYLGEDSDKAAYQALGGQAHGSGPDPAEGHAHRPGTTPRNARCRCGCGRPARGLAGLAGHARLLPAAARLPRKPHTGPALGP